MPTTRPPPARRVELDAFLGDAKRLRFRAGRLPAAVAQERARELAVREGLAETTPRLERAADGGAAWTLRGEARAVDAIARGLRAAGVEVVSLRAARPDRLLVHGQSLADQPAWLAALAPRYGPVGALWDPRRSPDLHPLWVLSAEPDAVAEWPLARVRSAAATSGAAGAASPPIHLLFLSADERPALELLALEVHPRFARDGFLLARASWRAARELRRAEEWIFVRRVVASGGATAQLDGPLGRGAFGSAPWAAEEIREETFLLPIGDAQHPRSEGPFTVWIAVRPPVELAPALPQDRSRFPRSADGLVRVGGGIVEKARDRSLPAAEGRGR